MGGRRTRIDHGVMETMTDRKLLVLALSVTMGLATLTGMGTYGFLTDSESIEITFSGNITENQAGNASTTEDTPSQTTEDTPSQTTEDTPSQTTEDTSDIPNASTRDYALADDLDSTQPAGNMPTHSGAGNQDRTTGESNDDATSGTPFPIDPDSVDLLAASRAR